ncbi:HlyD family secretion protein [Shewanella canadensis]|uniref:HlyD family secretion protein n=1 Tax=Shewanella canadensis TaxID=271096 RepID=A0A431WS20_9GAMM|nr:HlyD family secretion protein [Shewanella canadensis]RTR38015.1 HlyD family secretion protein [Shewanella canadensis]
MTPDQKFARWIKISMLFFVMIFSYFILADFNMPLTQQAMAIRDVTKVAPRVNGPIVAIHVKNNQLVRKGDVLFYIDPTPYQLNVEKAALNLEQTRKSNEELDASLAAAEADVKAISIIALQKQADAKRVNSLFDRHGVSQQQKDSLESDATAAKANLLASKARLKELTVRRGELDENNVNLRVALNQLKQAKLNLSYTQVRAEQDGTVTNLQLQAGAYASAGQPLLALVSSKIDIIADFREKSSRRATNGSRALVAFDGEPGRLYPALIASMDAGVSVGQFDANGQLATPTESNRWVRDAQRMRLHLNLDVPYPDMLPSGAQATVQLLPDNAVFGLLARVQISLLSYLHYIY